METPGLPEETVQRYLAYKFLDKTFDPSRYVYVPPFGDISRETISYLKTNMVLDQDLEPRYRIVFSDYIDRMNLKDAEYKFNRAFVAARKKMNERFGYISTEDVLKFMATNKLVQTFPHYTVSDVKNYISEYEQREPVLTKPEIDQIWQHIQEIRKLTDAHI